MTAPAPVKSPFRPLTVSAFWVLSIPTPSQWKPRRVPWTSPCVGSRAIFDLSRFSRPRVQTRYRTFKSAIGSGPVCAGFGCLSSRDLDDPLNACGLGQVSGQREPEIQSPSSSAAELSHGVERDLDARSHGGGQRNLLDVSSLGA